MGRIKGSKMTEDQKATMRAKRKANKEGKANALSAVAENLKYLSFTELETVSTFINRLKESRKSEQIDALLKEKEAIEKRIQELDNK